MDCFSGIPIFKYLFKPDIVVRKRIDINTFYNKKMPPFIFTTKKSDISIKKEEIAISPGIKR